MQALRQVETPPAADATARQTYVTRERRSGPPMSKAELKDIWAEPMSERDGLLMLATDRFANSEAYDRLSVDQYKEAFYSLVSTASEATLEKVSRHLSRNAYTPREIMIYLANERTEIAGPMLRNAPLLGQLDMVQLIEYHDLQHARILATRPDLGPSIITRLRQLGDLEVDKALSQNHAINLPVKKRLAQAKRQDARAIAPEGIGDQTEARAKPSRHLSYTIKRSTVPTAATHNVAEKKLLQAAARGGRLPIEADTPSKPATENGDVLEFAMGMEKMALTGSRQGMTILMQKRFQLSVVSCQQVLEDDSADTLGVLMKAADIDAAMANRINLLTFPNVGLSVENTRRAIKFYIGLDGDACREAVAQWPKASGIIKDHEGYTVETAADKRRDLYERSSEFPDAFSGVTDLVSDTG